MTEWFSPLELVRHAPDVLVSLLMGRRADPRLVEALAVPDAGVEDCSRDEADQPLQEIWLDYVADSGDGWDSTYAVASAVAQPALTLRDSKGVVHPTDRGSVLVFGGDQIYPSPSRKRYKQKFVRPFETALGWTESPHPKAFAIPGNHDWYDGLVAFTRLFCSRDWVGGWQTPQRQSYFALKLPQHWWLIGTDVQLGSDLDQPQIDFFRRVADEMEAEDRVILCTAEPHWIYAHLYEKYDKDVYRESNLRFLEEEILRKGKKHGGRVEVFLSGDLHHYRRHESAEGKQKITAGGGGAALHPTHGLDVSELSDGFRLKAAFPPKNVSARLTWQNLVFAVRNPTFGFLTAFLYLMASWTVMADVNHLGWRDAGQVAAIVARQVLARPNAFFWVVGIFLVFVLFTETHSPVYRFVAGSLHGLAHLAAAYFLGWGAAYFASGLGYRFGSVPYLLWCGLIVFVGGYVIGASLLGVYLLLSLNVFRRHSEEAFAALRIPDWKNFLRMRIDREGCLTIFPIGIRRVPRRWKPREVADSGPELITDDPRSTAPELIEDPIRVGEEA